MQQRALLLLIYLRKNTDCSCYFFRKRMEVWTGNRNGNHSNGSKIIRKESVCSRKEWTSRAMKKIVKRACAGMFAALMAVSAMSVPSSATSVSGTVGGIPCGGGNLITADYSSANTYASERMTLNVNLTYRCVERRGSVSNFITKYPSNANSPITNITTSCQKPSGVNIYSHSCKSSHNAVYTSPVPGDSDTWFGVTGWEYY